MRITCPERKTVRRLRAFLAAGVACVLLAGCVVIGDRADQFGWLFNTIPFFVFDNAPGYKKPAQVEVMDEPVNVVVALSGGGSYSAVFSAGVLEQLAYIPGPDGGSLLNSCQAISASSGGSLAAAYYGLYKPSRFSTGKQTSEFFQRFKSHMTVSISGRGWSHYLSHPWEAALRYKTRYRVGQSMANVMDDYLFGNATYGCLLKRELSGQSPVIVINATSLDLGRKFLFTTLNTQDNFTVNPAKLGAAIDQTSPDSDKAGLQMLARVAGTPIFTPFGFDSIDSDITDFRLSSAVACSSAYPVVPGPMALKNFATDGYVHLGDGGINDNMGIDALVQLYLAKLQRGETKGRLVIISISSLCPLKGRKVGDPNGYVGAIAYGEQAFDTQATRAQTFANTVYGSLQSIKLVSIDLGESCKAPSLRGRYASFNISEGDMHKVLAAAQELAETHRSEISSAIGGR
jgi:predicted acylesterase/phospholipase RssA